MFCPGLGPYLLALAEPGGTLLRLFDHSREGELAASFGTKVNDLSEGHSAEREREIPCLELTDQEIDALIVRVLMWHAAELARIANDITPPVGPP